MIKKGAMFGLDARIALAIFGALSVISGAALYSAIGKAKTTALYTDITEIAKAIEHYYLDNGVVMPVYDDQPYYIQTAALVENTDSLTTWKGPYLPYKKQAYLTYTNQLDYPKAANGIDEAPNGLISLVTSKNTTWTNWTVPISNRCNSGPDCFYWIGLAGFSNFKTLLKVDEMFDDDNTANGNIRVGFDPTVGHTIYYKVMNK